MYVYDGQILRAADGARQLQLDCNACEPLAGAAYEAAGRALRAILQSYFRGAVDAAELANTAYELVWTSGELPSYVVGVLMAEGETV